MQTGGAGRNQAKGGCDPSTLLSTSLPGVTHFYSSASVFRAVPAFLNCCLCCSHLCCALLFLTHTFCLGCICHGLSLPPSGSYSKNRGCFADVRKKYLADGFFSLPFPSFSKLLHLADCCAPCQEPECSSRAPH